MPFVIFAVAVELIVIAAKLLRDGPGEGDGLAGMG